MELKLTSPIPVSVNHYMKPRPFMSHGRPMVTMYEVKEAKDYKKMFTQYCKEEAQKQGWVKSDNKSQHYYIDCVFYFDQKRKDPNNYFKIMFDAMTDSDAIWYDDCVSLERVMGLYIDKDNPRVEMTIYPVEYMGIFPTQEHLSIFEDRCTRCNRYREGRCSLLLKAKDGFIQDDIDALECKKYKERKGEIK